VDIFSLLGSTMGLGFVSGVNLYAAVLTLGLGMRFGLIHPYPGISHLEALTNPYILAAAGVLYLVEFVADKIPWVDSVWDTFHSLIRPIGAAAMAATAIGSLDPATKTMVILASGGTAFSSHSTKAGTRVAVNHSPEPFSNIILSLFEDGIAVVGTWVAATHPIVMLVIVVMFLALFAWLSPKIFRLIRVELIAVLSLAKKLWSSKRRYVLRTTDGSTFAMGMGDELQSRTDKSALLDAMPQKHAEYWQDNFQPGQTVFRVRCVAGKGVKGLRNSVGYLHHTNDGLVFLTRRLFRFRTHRTDLKDVEDLCFKRGLLVDRVSFRTGKKQQVFVFFKHNLNHGQEAFDILQSSNSARGHSLS
jgi:hypothetical protein